MKNDTFGALTITVEGTAVSRFINAAALADIYMENIYRITPIHDLPGAARFTVAAKDFWELSELSERYNMRLTVERKSGLPFIIHNIAKRPALLIGLLLILTALLLCPRFVLLYSVVGYSDIKPDDILALAKENGCDIFDMPNNETLTELPKQLCLSDSRIAWAGVRKNGVTLVITIVEATQPPDIESVNEPRSLYATDTGRIVSVIPLYGHAKVKAGDVVNAGDELITGNVGTEEKPIAIRAKGVVVAQVIYTFSADVSAVIDDLTESGQKEDVTMVSLFGLSIKRNAYEDYKEETVFSLGLRGLFLPIRFTRITQRELIMGQRNGTYDELAGRAVLEAEAAMTAELDKNARIVSKTTEVILLDNGGVRAIISIVAEKNIVSE